MRNLLTFYDDSILNRSSVDSNNILPPSNVTSHCRRPYTEETLEELGESGVKNLIVVPVSFVSEHIETLVCPSLVDYAVLCKGFQHFYFY